LGNTFWGGFKVAEKVDANSFEVASGTSKEDVLLVVISCKSSLLSEQSFPSQQGKEDWWLSGIPTCSIFEWLDSTISQQDG
jgi:hypothetical protein